MLLLQHQLPSGQYIHMDPDQVDTQSHISEQCCNSQLSEHFTNVDYLNMYLNNNLEYSGASVVSNSLPEQEIVEYPGSTCVSTKDFEGASSDGHSCDGTIEPTQLAINNGSHTVNWHGLPSTSDASIAHCAASPSVDCSQTTAMLSTANHACSVICVTPGDHFVSYTAPFPGGDGPSAVGQGLAVMETVSTSPCAEDVLHPAMSYPSAATPLRCHYEYENNLAAACHSAVKSERTELQRGNMYWSGMGPGYYPEPSSQAHSYMYDARGQHSMNTAYTDYRPYGVVSPSHSPTASTGSGSFTSSIPSTSQRTVASSAQQRSSTGGQSKRNKKMQLFCAVCGDAAACQHYGVRTCEGCKGFFKRTVQKHATYVCATGLKNCVVDKRRRNRCQFCRFQKCLSFGMAPEVVRKDALKGRRGRLPSKMRRSVIGAGADRAHSSSDVRLAAADPTASHAVETHQSPVPTSSVLTEALVQAQISTWGSDNCAIEQFETGEGSSDVCSRDTEDVRQMVRLVKNCGEKVERFAVGIPGFGQLSDADRARLIECSSLDVLILHLAYSYNDETETFAFNSDFVLSRHQCHHSMRPWVESIVVLALHLKSLNVDHSTFACLTALAIVAERKNLENISQVGFLRHQITSALHEHLIGTDCHQIKDSSPQMQHLWTRLMSQLSYLRTLINQSLQQLFYLKLYGHIALPQLVDFVFKSNLPL